MEIERQEAEAETVRLEAERDDDDAIRRLARKARAEGVQLYHDAYDVPWMIEGTHMMPPLTPASVDELARVSAQEYRLPVEQMKWMIEACERFDPSHKTLAVALALLSQHVTVSTIVNAVIEAEAAVSQQPEHFQS